MTLRTDFFSTTFLKGSGEILFFAFLALLTRHLGQEDGGIVIQFVSLLMWIGPVAIVGSQNIISKYSSIYFIDDDVKNISELVLFAHLVLITILLLASSIFIYFSIKLSTLSTMYTFLPVIIFAWGSMLIFRELYRASERIWLSEGAFQVAKFLLPVLALLVFANTRYLTVDFVLLAVFIGLSIIFVVNLVVFVQTYGFVTRLNITWLKELLVHGPTVILRLTLERSDIVLIGFLIGPSAAAIYAVAVRIATIPTLLLDPIRNVLRPRIAKSYFHGDLSNLQTILKRGSILLTASTLLIVTPILLFPNLTFRIFGSLDSDTLGTLLIILLVGRVSNAIFGLNGPLLIMTEHHNTHLQIIAVISALYFGILFAMPAKTLVNLAILNSSMWVVLNLALLVACKYRLGFLPWVSFRLRRLKVKHYVER